MHTLKKNRFAVWIFGKLMGFSASLQNIPNRVTPPPFRLMQISSSFWQSRVLYVAARLNLATILGDNALHVKVLAQEARVHEDALFRLLRMLTSMGIFSETSPRWFANNRLSEPLRDDSLQSIRAMILMHNSPEMSRPWFEQLENGVIHGESPFVLAHGTELFDYMDKHSEFDKLFSQAMDSVEALVGDSYATDFDWGCFDRLIDVGGSRGAKTINILKRYRNMTALIFDRPQVVAEAKEFLEKRIEKPVLERISFEGGDMQEYIPPSRSSRDVYLLSAVFHGMDDAVCIESLKRLYKAVGGTNATVVILEMVAPEQNADYITASFDMQMFMATRGRERTLREWENIFIAGGFKLTEIVGVRTFGKILVLNAL